MTLRLGRSGCTRSTALGVLGAWCAASLLTGCADDLDLVGTVERRSIELAAPVSETLVEITVEEGQRVDAGQVIARLDTEVAEAELVAAEAARDAASAQLAEAEREFTRLESLRRANVVAAQELDRARRARDSARAATAERAARVAQASKRLADLTIQSYAPGVVDQLPFEQGERVSAGGIVAVVVPDEAPWVRVWLPAREVARADSRATAEIEVEGVDQTLAGVLEEVSREPEFTPHYALTERESAHLVYEARIRLTDAPETLRPGLPARVRLSSRTDG